MAGTLSGVLRDVQMKLPASPPPTNKRVEGGCMAARCRRSPIKASSPYLVGRTLLGGQDYSASLVGMGGRVLLNAPHVGIYFFFVARSDKNVRLRTVVYLVAVTPDHRYRGSFRGHKVDQTQQGWDIMRTRDGRRLGEALRGRSRRRCRRSHGVALVLFDTAGRRRPVVVSVR